MAVLLWDPRRSFISMPLLRCMEQIWLSAGGQALPPYYGLLQQGILQAAGPERSKAPLRSVAQTASRQITRPNGDSIPAQLMHLKGLLNVRYGVARWDGVAWGQKQTPEELSYGVQLSSLGFIGLRENQQTEKTNSLFAGFWFKILICVEVYSLQSGLLPDVCGSVGLSSRQEGSLEQVREVNAAAISGTSYVNAGESTGLVI